MGRPKGNGLVEITGENRQQDSGWFFMDLVRFLSDEENTTGDYWHQRFLEAKSGNCAYKDKCPRYARTIEKHGKRPVQLNLF